MRAPVFDKIELTKIKKDVFLFTTLGGFYDLQVVDYYYSGRLFSDHQKEKLIEFAKRQTAGLTSYGDIVLLAESINRSVGCVTVMLHRVRKNGYVWPSRLRRW